MGKQTISRYTHCGRTQLLDVAELSGYFGDRVTLILRDEDDYREPQLFALNSLQAKALEDWFVERHWARLKAEAEADPGTASDEEDEAHGEPQDN